MKAFLNISEIMLSILIPIYNFDCRKLVYNLWEQCEKSVQQFEILCFDDCSDAHFQNLNYILNQLPNVQYKVLPQNVGRSRNRNLLAQAAKHPYLLFMDGDSGVVRTDYIEKYFTNTQTDRVIYGGTFYAESPPENPAHLLHWKVGSAREQMPAQMRQAQPYSRFTTNNFLVPKAIFDNIQFEEKLRQYGHEDTLFAQALQERNIPILHLDNPLEHLGLETAEVFLAKSEKAIENLVLLAQTDTAVETRLYSTFLKLKQYRLNTLYKLCFSLSKPLIRVNLRGKHPNLKLFDAYKLGLLCEK